MTTSIGTTPTQPVRLAVLAASPIYYQAPLYRRLASDPRLDFTAIFASSASQRPHDAGYGMPIAWDVPQLEGFRTVFLSRSDANPIGGSLLDLIDPDVVHLLRRERFELLWIHGYNFITHLLAAITQLAIGGHLAIREEQTILHPRPSFKEVLKRPVLSALIGRASALLYIGTANRCWFEHYGGRPERLFFTPYSVDNDRLRRERRVLAEHRDQLRTSFGIKEAGPVILTVSRLISKKQPEVLVEAFAQVRREMSCTLVIVGSGELESDLRRVVTSRRIPDVIFTGFLNQSHIAKAYVAADVFALVSREHETWGLVVNEAMNFGLPVIVSDKVGSGYDLVIEGANGFIVPAHSVRDLTDRLRLLVADEELRRRFGANSLSRIASWNYDVAAEGIVRAVAATVGSARWNAAGMSTDAQVDAVQR